MVSTRGRRLVGVALALTGALIVVDRVGDVSGVVDLAAAWWPVGIAALLLANMATFLRKPLSQPSPVGLPMLVSTALLLVTGVVLLRTTGMLRFEVAPYLMPAGLIVGGLVLALWGDAAERQVQASVAVNAVLRRSIQSVASKGVRHVRILALLGDVQLDLSRAELHRRAEVHATVWRARVLLHCPGHWQIEPPRTVGSNIEVRYPKPDEPATTDPAQSRALSIHTMGGHGLVVVTLATA